MAAVIDYSGLSTYTDQLTQPIVRELVLQGTTFDYITIIEGVDNVTALNIETSTLIPITGNCVSVLNATGSVALTQRNITSCLISVVESLCGDLQKQYWLGKLMDKGSYGETITPKMFAEAYTADKVAKIAANVEDLFWKGAVSGTYSASLNACNGLFYVLDSTAATSSVITTTYSGALTTANALTVIDDMIRLMNTSAADVLTQPDLTIFMNYGDFNTLLVALRNANYFHFTPGQDPKAINQVADNSFLYPGHSNLRVVATRGIQGLNKIVLSPASNLVAGFDSFNDSTNFKIWYSQDFDLVNLRAKWRQGANVYFPQYIVYKRS